MSYETNENNTRSYLRLNGKSTRQKGYKIDSKKGKGRLRLKSLQRRTKLFLTSYDSQLSIVRRFGILSK